LTFYVACGCSSRTFGLDVVAFAHRRYADSDHELVPLSALPDGPRFVFAPVATQGLPIARVDERADSGSVMRALAESERAYADSARTLSSPERLPEPDVNRLARAALNTLKAPNLALLILRHNVELHPTSARAMARLADGYLVAGDTASAVARLRRAIDMSPKSPTELPTDARAKLATLWRCCSTISGLTTRLRGRRT